MRHCLIISQARADEQGDVVWPLLNTVFDRVGILPDINNPNEKPRVQVIGSVQSQLPLPVTPHQDLKNRTTHSTIWNRREEMISLSC